MSVFVEVKEKCFLKDSVVAYDVAFKGCQKAVAEGGSLSHWVLTSAKGVTLDMFDSFGKLVKLLCKDGAVFEFFIVEARNDFEGCHLHVLVSTNLVVKVHLQNLWVRVHRSDIVKVIPICESEGERLDEAILRITKYVTFGNHKKSMLRYGYSSGWIGGIYCGE